MNRTAACSRSLRHWAYGPRSNAELIGETDESLSAELIEELPYRVRDDFLSPGERQFFAELVSAVAGRAIVCPKVRLADILFTTDRR